MTSHDVTTTSPPNDPVSATTNPIPLSANPTVENSGYKPPVRDQDAQSRKITIATGEETYGIPNQHLTNNLAYSVGVSHDQGLRRTMEDAYSFVVDFARVRGQGYFAVFDGHAGKHAAEWCGNNFHDELLKQLVQHPNSSIPEVLNHTFHSVDVAIGELVSQNEKMHSGCTAVAAFLRLEDAKGKQSFLGEESIDALLSESPENSPEKDDEHPYPTPDASSSPTPADSPRPSSPSSSGRSKKRSILKKGSDVVSAIKSFTSSSSTQVGDTRAGLSLRRGAITPPLGTPLRRVLYTANAGDARAVLCRGGRAIRLTYDHKGTDTQEAGRILQAGGYVLGGRVNGVLAVTRSLGDSAMKELIVGSPYTTETELGDDDEFLIIACDGLWDVATDQKAVDIVRHIMDPKEASAKLVEYALEDSTDNITVIVVRFLSNASKQEKS